MNISRIISLTGAAIFPVLTLVRGVDDAAAAKPVAAAVAKPPQSRLESDLKLARAAAKEADPQGAEAALTAHSYFQRGTHEWHFETALKLAQLNSVMARGGDDPTMIDKITDQALEHLKEADHLARTKQAHAQVKAANGALLLRYKGDLKGAIESYQAAAAADPDDPGVKETLARLMSTEAKLRIRLHLDQAKGGQ